jgi:hypothetical protein
MPEVKSPGGRSVNGQYNATSQLVCAHNGPYSSGHSLEMRVEMEQIVEAGMNDVGEVTNDQNGVTGRET